MRKFISGKFEGTNLEIMPSRAATQLADGTPIREMTDDARRLNPTQLLHADGELDVHARQGYPVDSFEDETTWALGPTIAQQWKAEYNAKLTGKGWTARYYREDGGRR